MGDGWVGRWISKLNYNKTLSFFCQFVKKLLTKEEIRRGMCWAVN